MLPGARVSTLLVLLATGAQAPRPALERCDVAPERAESRTLPDRLVEVSGLAVGPGSTLLLHGDERGRVTTLDAAELRITRETDLKGVPRDDFEGIAVSGDSVALMTSAGKLYFFRLGALTVPFTVVSTGLGKECELEGLAWQRASSTLFLPCKNPHRKGVTGLTVYRYRLGSAPGPAAPIVVSGAELSRVAGFTSIRATAVEVDPVTSHLVVLSSNPEMLVEIDTAGRAIVAKRLSLKLHPQSEGLTLTSDALWIADEGAGRRGLLAEYSCR